MSGDEYQTDQWIRRRPPITSRRAPPARASRPTRSCSGPLAPVVGICSATVVSVAGCGYRRRRRRCRRRGGGRGCGYRRRGRRCRRRGGGRDRRCRFGTGGDRLTLGDRRRRCGRRRRDRGWRRGRRCRPRPPRTPRTTLAPRPPGTVEPPGGPRRTSPPSDSPTSNQPEDPPAVALLAGSRRRHPLRQSRPGRRPNPPMRTRRGRSR